MIVQSRGSSLLLIRQPDHAALSAEIMQRWRHGGFTAHPRRESVLSAIREHDNGWEEVDRSPLLDTTTGTLLDFMAAPADVRREIWPRGVNRLSADPWAAALVAQHALHIYRRYRDDAAWEPFFGELEALRHAQLARAGGPGLDALLADYFFVRMGDLISLTFCNGWSEGPEQPGFAIRLKGDDLSVTPDPFEAETISLSVPARVLPLGPFASAADVARLFAAAPIVALRGVLKTQP